MTKALNEQIKLEGTASFIYLSMASWCDTQGLEGCDMLRIFHYLSEVDAQALVPAIKQPANKWKSIQVMLKEVYEHEKKVTASINNLLDIARAENDYNTENFLQWYINEQREEENLMRSILDKVNLIGEGPMSLYYIDKEISAVNKAEEKAEAAGEA